MSPVADQNEPAASGAGMSRRKRWVFRGAAVLLAPVLLLLVEGTLSLFDVGRPDLYDDPFVGFSDVQPLFVPSDDNARYEIPKARQAFFEPDSFPAEKSPQEFRIFVLGGSTVAGRPYGSKTSFTAWLQLSLSAVDPSRDWNVVNCGGVSYASYRLIPILAELERHEPDLYVICTGQNEFLEDRTYASIKQQPRWLAWTEQRLSRLRSVTLLRSGWQSIGNDGDEAYKPALPTEVDARLDWARGMEAYHRDDAWQADVVAHYESNLRRMAAIVHGQDVPLIFVSPVSNLDWVPFKVEHRVDLTDAERTHFNALWDEATTWYERDTERSLELLEQAIAIDGQHAGVLFAAGQTCQGLNRLERARELLTAAKDQDVCPLRMLESMQEVFQRVAEETSTPLVDANARFAERSQGGIVGDEWLVDHVHPTLEGHQLIAQWLLEELVRQEFAVLKADWKPAIETAYQEHLEGIEEIYFVKGQYRNETVQRWARGQATRERGEASKSDGGAGSK